MRKVVLRFKEHYSYQNLQSKDFETRVGTIYLISGFLVSLLAIILTTAYGMSFWIVLPNILLALVCIVIPVISDDIKKSAFQIMLFVGIIYFPYIFLIAGGLEGPSPVYFIIIVAYVALLFNDKKAFWFIAFMIVYFCLIVVVTNAYPNLLIHDEVNFLKPTDIIVAVSSVSILISLITSGTFKGFKMEQNRSALLMEELEKRNEELRILSHIDQLTNVYNRRYFKSAMEKEIEHCNQTNSQFFILMIDLDDFKDINDHNGHLFGDSVLRKVAAVIKKSTRDYDLICRYGGEEFCVSISHLNPEESIVVAERIRSQVEEIPLRNDNHITVSIGLASFSKGDTLNEIIERADKNLYIAKEKGKNCVVK